MPVFLQSKALKPFVGKDLIEKSIPIKFQQPNGSIANGYRAELLPAVCEAYLKAREAGTLNYQQKHVAKQAEIIMRGLATVGIIALIDEVTGYQAVRPWDALNEILEKFIAKELRPYVKRFPREYVDQIYRLRNWKRPTPTTNPPQVVGHYTNDLIYDRLAPGILAELQRITPRTPSGARKHRFHQRLTDDIGHPKLREHFAGLLALMRAASDWEQFRVMVNQALPRYNDTGTLCLGFDHSQPELR